MCKIESLSSHFGTYASILNFKDEITKSGVSEIKVPHVFKGALVNGTNSSARDLAAAKGVATIGYTGHLVDDLEGIVK